MKISNFNYWIFCLGLLVAAPSYGAVIMEYSFRGHDQFTLKRSGAGFKYKDRRVDLGAFEGFTNLFNQEMDVLCEDLPKRADLIVNAKTSAGKVIKRKFYIKAGQVSDGKACLEVTGEGLYFLPLHSSWYRKPKNITIGVGNKIIIKRNGQEFVAFEKVDGEWRTKTSQFFTNWNFFNNFIGALKDFEIDARLHSGIANTTSATTYAGDNFELVTPYKTYKFIRINEGLWAAQFPKVAWLIASNRWGVFEDMSASVWQDPNRDKLSKLMNKTLDTNQRIAAFTEIKSRWSKTIKHALQNIVLDETENDKIKDIVVRELRTHPSDENMKVLARALTKTQDPAVQEQITRALLIKNPKGKKITADLTDEERAKYVRQWQEWAKKLK